MNKLVTIVFALVFVGGCVTSRGMIRKDNNTEVLNTEVLNTEVLTIRWQRLVDASGQTCQRCGLTQEEVKKAFHSLKQSLAPLGIEVTLQEGALDPATCAKDISQSNRIWISERSLEDWLGAEVGKSPCGPCCEELGSDVECRTVEFEGKTCEAIPAELIVKAGLSAASELLNVESNKPCDEPCNEPCSESCRENKTSTKTPPESCCPETDSGPKEDK